MRNEEKEPHGLSPAGSTVAELLVESFDAPAAEGEEETRPIVSVWAAACCSREEVTRLCRWLLVGG